MTKDAVSDLIELAVTEVGGRLPQRLDDFNDLAQRLLADARCLMPLESDLHVFARSVEAQRKHLRHETVLLSRVGLCVAQESGLATVAAQFKFLLARASLIINYHIEDLSIPNVESFINEDGATVSWDQLVQARLALAKAYRNIGKLDTALDYYRSSLSEEANRGNQLSVANHKFLIAKLLGNYYRQPTRCIEQLTSVAEELEFVPVSAERDRILARCFDEMANIYRKFLSDTQQAEHFYAKAISLCQRQMNSASLGRVLSHLGLLYWEIGRLTEGRDLLRQGLDLTVSELGQERGVGIRLGQLALLEAHVEHPNIAPATVALVDRGLEINRDHNDFRSEAKNLQHKAEILQMRGDIYEARRALEQGRDLAGHHGLRNLEAAACINLGDIMRDDFRQFDVAHRLYKVAFELINADWERIFEIPPDPSMRSHPEETERMLHTQIAKYEADIKRVTDRLIQSLQSGAKALMEREREVLVSAVHRLRSPLTGLRGTIDAIANDTASGTLRDDLIEDARSSLEKIENRIQSFLDAATVGDSELRRLTPVALNELIEDIVRIAAADFRDVSLDATLQLAIDQKVVELDAGGLEVILKEIVNNACEASMGGGRRVLVVSELTNGSCEEDRASNEPKLGISVHDNGPGIVDGMLAHMFEPLSSTKPNGRGIGLNLSKRLCDRMGGEIRVDRFESWTIFSVFIPVALRK